MTQAVFEKRLKEMAVAVPLLCCAAGMFSIPSRKQVVLVGHKNSTQFETFLAAAHASYDPNRTVSRLCKHLLIAILELDLIYSLCGNLLQVIHVDPTDDTELQFWEENNRSIAVMAKNNFAADKVVALVCQNFTCKAPITDPGSLEAMLAEKPS